MKNLKESKAVIAALLANIGIALCKLVAYLLTISSSMMAEAIHSLVDSLNEVLLLVGKSRGERSADELHSFGYGRDRYFYSFVVGFLLFTAGGLFALFEAFEKFEHPEAIDSWHWVPIVVLGASIVMEGLSFRTAIHEARETGATIKSPADIVRFVKNTKSAETPVVVLEDSAALIGLVFALVGISGTLITGDGRWDAVGSGAIGVLLICVASLLIVEMKSLLLGESATTSQLTAIKEIVNKDPNFQGVLQLRTSYIGPTTLLIALKVAIAQSDTKVLLDLTNEVNLLESDIRAHPLFSDLETLIFVETDVYQDNYQRIERLPHPPSTRRWP
jgi:cation diffusion facilitator family transporter